MRNIFLFIVKYHLTFLFLLLQGFAIFLLVQFSGYHKAGFINTSTTVSGNVFSAVNEFKEYFKLKSVNEELAKENARLRALTFNSLMKVEGCSETVDDTIFKQQFNYISAKVVNNTVNLRNNYIIINRGYEHGIEPEMGVISPLGVVGIVKDVSANFSSVLSLLNKNTKISARFKNSPYSGIVTWEGTNAEQANLIDIPIHVKVKEGDTVITSGYSSLFPEDIQIGTVAEIYQPEGENFYEIKLNLSTDFYGLSYVFVVDNLMKEQLDELELKIEETEKDDK